MKLTWPGRCQGSGVLPSHGRQRSWQATHLGDKPTVNDLIGSIKIMLDAYSEGKIDRLYLVHNEFVNSMTQTPVVTQLLPASGVGSDDEICKPLGLHL